MKTIIATTAIALITTTASAGNITINGHAHDACVEYNGNLSGNTVTINGGSQSAYVVDTSTGRNCSNRTNPNNNSGGGSDFDSDDDRSVSRVQVQGNDLVIGVTNQDPDGAYSKEYRVTLPTNTGADGINGTNGTDGIDGTNGTDGIDGTNGINGTNGADGAQGANGTDGKDGQNGKAAVAPLGSLSFAAAEASFNGSGLGFGLSDSNYGGLEGSFVAGFDLDNNWRVVAGVTTDFNNRHAASVGVGFSF